MTAGDQLLIKLLRLLVREYGYNQVASALDVARDGEESRVFPSRQTNRSKKLSAIDQVVRLGDLDSKRTPLEIIAKRFDEKRFLPALGDIREFLSMMGADQARIKNRTDGFRKLLPRLVGLPEEKLEQLAHGANYSGPARLGPLSDAIRSAGEAIRQSPELSEKKG
jgi:hypothetical protein